MDPNDIVRLAKAVPEVVVQEAYKDVAAGTLKEVGKIAEEISKTMRLILFPVQLGAALQDRFSKYIDRAIRQVPQQRLVAPMESIALPIAEKLRFQEATSPLTDLYVNLLSRAMDGERVGEAHPAFIGVITQLAPDEIVFIRELAKNAYTLVLKMDENWRTPKRAEVRDAILKADLSYDQKKKAAKIRFDYEILNQPEFFYMFLEHIYHLGLMQYTNDPSNEGEFRGYRWVKGSPYFVFIHLSSFGKLFYKACISDPLHSA